MLRAGVMEDGAVRRSDAGTPQGGVISPCLCNVYLHRLDRQWAERGHGVLVRYADDLVVMCRTRAGSRARPAALRAILRSWGSRSRTPRRGSWSCAKAARGWTSSASITAGCAATRPRQASHFLARWPSRQAMQHARDRIRELTDRRRLLLPGRGRRAGPQPVPARLGGLLPLRKLRPSSTRSRSTPLNRLGRFRRQAPQARPTVTAGGCCPPITRPAGADRPQRNHRRATAQPAVAPGTLNAGGEERRRAVYGRTACTVRCGGGRKPGQSATCRAAQAPLADPTGISWSGRC